MQIENLLNRLQKVRRTGEGRWIACCPARDDRSPSMAIRVLDDGRILLHDFGGATVSEILQSVGLDFADLFPQTSDFHLPKAKRPFIASDVLRCLALDVLIVLQMAAAIRRGESLSDAHHLKLNEVAAHFQAAERICNA